MEEEQGLPHVANTELLAHLEAILLELRRRLNSFLEVGTSDVVAADEGFNFAGGVEVSLAHAAGHARWVRSRLRAKQA